MNLPNDADGDVIRRLHATGFDFGEFVDIDFNVEFDEGQPIQHALEAIATEFPSATIIDDWIHVTVHGRVTYTLVTRAQARLTELAAPYGGRCDSWGVFQTPR